MLYINPIITLLLPFLLGLAVLSISLQEKREHSYFWEKIALAFSIGLGYLIILMFLLALLKISLSFTNIAISTLSIIIMMGAYLLRKKCFCLTAGEIRTAFNFKTLKLDLIEGILIFLIALKTLYAYFTALVKPLVDVDAFQFYSIVAKGVFYGKNYFDPYLKQFMGDKPPFAFLSQGWVFIGLHTINDALLKILTPTLFLCLLIIFYSVLRRYYQRKISLLFTFFLSTLPFIVYHVATAYADFPITFYYALATIYLYLFMKEIGQGNKKKAYANLIVSFVLLGISVWVKKAGFILSGVNILVLLSFLLLSRKSFQKEDVKFILIPLIIFMITIFPWVMQGQIGTFIRVIKSSTLSPAPHVTSPAAFPINKTGTILTVFSRKMFLYADWHLTWALFIITLTFFYKKSLRQPLNFLLAIIILDIFALFVQFESGETFQWLLDGTLFDRLAMNEVPIVLFFCAEAIIPGLKGSFSAGENRASSKSKKGS